MGGSSSDKRVVLLCQECGERTVLGGPLWVWLSGKTFFGCECGKRLTLAHRTVEGEEVRVGTSSS